MDFGGGRDSNALQVSAVMEGLFSDFLQLRTLRKDNRTEIGAVGECPLSDALHACRYLHLCDAGPQERTISDLPQLRAFCESYLLKIVTIFEGLHSDALHARRYVHFLDSTSIEPLFSNAG